MDSTNLVSDALNVLFLLRESTLNFVCLATVLGGKQRPEPVIAGTSASADVEIDHSRIDTSNK